MFEKILIANRGEIAVRVIRACNEMGIQTVAVYSEADAESLHVALADEAYCIGPASVKDSYLNMSAILAAAEVSGAQAIHPGYGLLSENAQFARLCEQCSIAFIGPDADVIARMGDKDEARKTMQEAGVPVVPGTDILVSVDEALLAAEAVGFPLLIKARAGGGGRGIRLVTAADEFAHAFAQASHEADVAFGDGAVYIEKYLKPVKHIEMQVLADTHGNVVCLGERDCSVQNRNQKLIEECPAVVLPEATRQAMIATSVEAARHTGYTGAGTIEYLYDQATDSFYFLEMNTRLQVEHPITEAVTGIDLVKWQIRVAAGRELGFTQDEIKHYGHAIEVRINASDPRHGFRPSAGKIEFLHVPGGPAVRFDSFIYQGCTIPPYYDSMVAKLIVHCRTREIAIRKMNAVLCELVIDGIATTADLAMDLIAQPEFVSGEYTTDFMTTLLEESAAGKRDVPALQTDTASSDSTHGIGVR